MNDIEDTRSVDRTEELAGMLGVTDLDFAELFGANWAECLVPHRDPLRDGEEPASPWHVSGRPPILMLRVVADGIEVAVPDATWAGPGDRVHVPTHVERLDRDEVGTDRARAVVYATRLRRKRAIRYCRFCHMPTPPEMRSDDDVCAGCAERWLGIIL